MPFLTEKHAFIAVFATFLLIGCSVEDDLDALLEEVVTEIEAQEAQDAQESQVGLQLMDAWSRPTMTSTQPGAVFLAITNHQAEADTLLGASTPRAEKVEIHGHRHEDGVVAMFMMDELDVPAGETTALAPGGLHLMLFGLTEPLVEGDVYPLSLTFARAGVVDVEVSVGTVGSKEAPQMMHNHGN